MRIHTFFTQILVIGGLSASATLSVGQDANRSLNMLCSAGLTYCEVLAKSFQRATGIAVNMASKSTGEVLAQLSAERNNPKTDLWYGGTGDPHLQAAEIGLLEEYRSPAAVEQHEWALNQARAGRNSTVGVYLGPLGFSYNPEVLAKKNLPVPQCWADLVKPGYKGEIQMAHPASSGTAYVVIATVVQIMGEDAAFQYMKALHTNISQYPRSGSAPMKNAARGENAIGLSFIADVVMEAGKGAPIKWVTPCEGTGYEIGSMSIMKGARNPEAARKFYDWALTTAVQNQTHAESQSPQYGSNKAANIHPSMPNLNSIKFINYDFAKYGSAAVRKGLLARWDKEIGSIAK
jgi:iron(III) transport system substrate-binding protein